MDLQIDGPRQVRFIGVENTYNEDTMVIFLLLFFPLQTWVQVTWL